MAEKILKATHEGTLAIGESCLRCAVLENRQRVLTLADLMQAIGRSRTGYTMGNKLPPFLSAKNLEPFISKDLRCGITPILFKTLRGGGHRGHALGYKAELLCAICKVFLLARKSNALQPNQLHIAEQCETLLYGLADVGIIALVDEATGYQQTREKDELQKILEAYVLPEYLSWTKRFPDEFYEQIFRLKGWRKPSSVKRPQCIGTITSKIVYSRLPQGVLEELRKINPVVYSTGQRRYKHHQYLTQNIGHEHLNQHLVSVIALMRGCDSWEEFERIFEKSFPIQLPKIEDDNLLN